MDKIDFDIGKLGQPIPYDLLDETRPDEQAEPDVQGSENKGAAVTNEELAYAGLVGLTGSLPTDREM